MIMHHCFVPNADCLVRDKNLNWVDGCTDFTDFHPIFTDFDF
jgi:hypothetical protein